MANARLKNKTEGGKESRRGRLEKKEAGEVRNLNIKVL
jgi:hypothetical protein